MALCGPSRNSFMTGRRPDTTRCYVSDHKFRKRGMEDAITMPGYFKENGYETTGAGKIFHPGECHKIIKSFLLLKYGICYV